MAGCASVQLGALDGVHPSVRSFLAEQQAQRVWFDDARAFANANTVDALWL
jgi:molybdopterin-guanine dinucleotide biosynthesis protein A